MIIDQLFENKKQLDEINPHNYDSDEDYYNDLYGDEGDDDEVDDADFDNDDIDDMDHDEESHYEKYVRVNNLEEEQLDEIDWKAIQKKAGQIGKGAQKFTQNLSQTGDAVAGAANAIGGAGKELGKQLVARPVGATYNAVKGGLNKAADVATNTYNDVKAGAQKVGRGVDTVATDVGDAGTWAGEKAKQAGRGVANVAGGVGQTVGAVAGGATTGLGRAAAHGFNTGVKNVGGNAVNRLQTNVFKQKSNPVEIKKQIDMKQAEIQQLEKDLKAATKAPEMKQKNMPWVPTASGQARTVDDVMGATAPTTPTSVAAPTPAAPAVGMPSAVNYGAGFNKPAAAPAKPVPNFNQLGQGGYSTPTGINTPVTAEKKLSPAEYISRIGTDKTAVAETVKQVKKMLETAQTKEDIARIKIFIDRQFTRNGMLSETAMAQRDHLIERVTQIGAVKRRQFARRA